MTLFLPPGINPDEPRYHSVRGGWPGLSEPESGYDDNGRVFYRWSSDLANAHTQYTFGASFPAKLIPAESIVKEPLIKFNADDIGGACGCLVMLGFLGSFIWGIYEAIWGAKKRKIAISASKDFGGRSRYQTRVDCRRSGGINGTAYR